MGNDDSLQNPACGSNGKRKVLSSWGTPMFLFSIPVIPICFHHFYTPDPHADCPVLVFVCFGLFSACLVLLKGAPSSTI